MKKEKHINMRNEVLTDILHLTVSGILFAISYNMFLVPGGIIIGGAGGVATTLHILFGLPTGAMIFLINVPLVLLFWHFYGFHASVKSIIGITVSSLFVDVTALLGVFQPAFPDPASNQLLYALFGGVVIGAAVGVMFARGYTTGGSDLAALLIKMKCQRISTATIILALDALVVVAAAIATGDYTSVLYSILATFMASSILSRVTSGFDKTRIAYIFSENYRQIADALTEKLDRGVTLLDGLGWYTKEQKKVILCVVKKNELFTLKKTVRDIDKNSFMILGEADETIGLGFKETIGDTVMEPKKPK